MSRAAAGVQALSAEQRSRLAERGYARYAWVVLAYTLLVIAWGAFVRATGSGAGCGRHWPLCNGVVVPRSPSTATWIEYAHRTTSGIALVLVGGLLVGAWRRFPAGHRVRAAAVLSAFFLTTEALVGAGLVLFELVGANASAARAAWMAGHLANTFFLLGALALTAWWAVPAEEGGRSSSLAETSRRWLAAALGAVLVLGMTGAVAALGDTLFRASAPEAPRHVFVRLRVWHPLLALLAAPLILGLCARARAAPSGDGARKLATGLGAVYLAQLGIGAVNVWFRAPIAIQLVHLLFSDAVWILLVLFVATVWAEETGDRTRASQLSCATTATET